MKTWLPTNSRRLLVRIVASGCPYPNFHPSRCVPRAGFEPAASAFVARRSIQTELYGLEPSELVDRSKSPDRGDIENRTLRGGLAKPACAQHYPLEIARHSSLGLVADSRCGKGIRTLDLRIMSPPRYLCAIPHSVLDLPSFPVSVDPGRRIRRNRTYQCPVPKTGGPP